MSAKVFISHSSADGQTAKAICGALEKRGLACWLASRDINPGEDFQGAIVQAIRSASVMVLVFSQNANNSDEIKKELVLASQSNVVIIPVRVENVAPNDSLAYQFATRQWVNLFEDWEKEIERLSVWIAQITGSAAAFAPPPLTRETPVPDHSTAQATPVEPTRSSPKARRHRLAGAFLIVIGTLLSLGLVYLFATPTSLIAECNMARISLDCIPTGADDPTVHVVTVAPTIAAIVSGTVAALLWFVAMTVIGIGTIRRRHWVRGPGIGLCVTGVLISGYGIAASVVEAYRTYFDLDPRLFRDPAGALFPVESVVSAVLWFLLAAAFVIAGANYIWWQAAFASGPRAPGTR
jgi:hypothetical protein